MWQILGHVFLEQLFQADIEVSVTPVRLHFPYERNCPYLQYYRMDANEMIDSACIRIEERRRT